MSVVDCERQDLKGYTAQYFQITKLNQYSGQKVN